MAITNKLTIRMKTSDGEKNFIYNYFNPEATATQVKNLISAILTNGAMFINIPSEAVSAVLTTTTTANYDLSD